MPSIRKKFKDAAKGLTVPKVLQRTPRALRKDGFGLLIPKTNGATPSKKDIQDQVNELVKDYNYMHDYALASQVSLVIQF